MTDFSDEAQIQALGDDITVPLESKAPTWEVTLG